MLNYIKDQMKTLAKRTPSLVMIDDDVGLVYKQTKGCACKYHIFSFSQRKRMAISRKRCAGWKNSRDISHVSIQLIWQVNPSGNN